MRAPSALVLVLAVALGGVASAQRQRPIQPPPAQPLLGVGTTPQPTPSGSADAFFDDNLLHRIDLAMNAKDWQTLKDNYLDNTYYPTDFKADGQPVLRNVGIRSRGNGSRSGVKPGLRVDFDRYTIDQKFLGLKSFVLRNNTQDASNMHERLSMLLFRRLNMAAPREAHTRVYVNDVYQGLFTIVESIDKDFLKRTYNEDTGHLYKYDYPPDQTPWFFTDKGGDPSQYVPLPFKAETLETDPQGEFFVQWVQAVTNATPASLPAAVSEYLDLQKFLKHVAIEVFVGDYDGFIGNYGINNFYLYRLTNQKRFNLIAWDKSEAFQAGPTSPIFHNIYDVGDDRRNKLVNKALDNTTYYNAFLDALVEAANSAADGQWMEKEIEKQYNQIRQAAFDDNTKPYSNQVFEDAVIALRDFAQRRSQFVIGEVNASRK
jgi:spore coat protein H